MSRYNARSHSNNLPCAQTYQETVPYQLSNCPTRGRRYQLSDWREEDAMGLRVSPKNLQKYPQRWLIRKSLNAILRLPGAKSCPCSLYHDERVSQVWER